MIRQMEINELDTVMKIWIETNIEAHRFIPENYWKENYEIVKEMLPNAKIYVYENKNQILGFVGVIDSYIAGIFVNKSYQSNGIGKILLNYIKQEYLDLSLHVYIKNVRAVKFYLREEFVKIKEQIDENTGEFELAMNWKK